MRHYISIGKEPNLQKIVLISTILHLILITLVFIPIKTGKKDFKTYYVDLVVPMEIDRGSLNGHGETMMVKKREPSINDKGASSDKPIELEKKAEAINKEIELLRAIRELSRRKQGKMEEIEIIRKRINAGATDTAYKGEGIESDSYYAIISKIIWSKWGFPNIESSGLEVIVSIRIDGKGNIISQEVEKTSGNVLFDQSALRAISKANPLPPPPMGIETEIGVRFYL